MLLGLIRVCVGGEYCSYCWLWCNGGWLGVWDGVRLVLLMLCWIWCYFADLVAFAMLLLFLLVCSIAFRVFWWRVLVRWFLVGVVADVSGLDWFWLVSFGGGFGGSWVW